MTTTAYPPSTGGVQSHVAELRARLENFDADVVTLWLKNRNDWLLGTTLRLGESRDSEAGAGVRTLGWSGASRARMAPWALLYYPLIPLTARRIAAEMIPALDRAVDSAYVLIHNHRIGREFLAQASLEVARAHRIPFVLTPHHHPKWHGYRYSGWTQVYREADAVLALTKAESAELERLGVAAERVHLIGGATDDPLPADAARFRKRIGVPDRPLVVFLGQLYEYKGVAELLAASDILHAKGIEAEVAFVGPPTRFSRNFFARHKRPWIHLLGKVDEQTKWDALEAATAVCVPSRHEAFGRVYLEAWTKGKAIIGGRIPAVSEVVTDGETGLLVDPTSSVELAAALERLLTDTALAARLGEGGRGEVAERFTWQRVVARVEAAYETVLRVRRGA